MNIIEKLKSINPWHFLWLSIVSAELFTLLVTWAQIHLLGFHYPEHSYYFVGAIDSLFVPLIVVPMLIIFVSQISKLRQELQTRKEAEQQIRFLAYYDQLTNLPNRIFFKELVERAITYAKRHELMMAVMFIDLDNFKRVNDTLGHDMGDKLLREVSVRLLRTTRSSDCIAIARGDDGEEVDVMSRLGGDEFILLLRSLKHPQDACDAASRILKDIAEPFVLDSREVFLTASIGISLFPADGQSGDDMLKNADVAMYHAKKRGRNNVQYYSQAMTSAAFDYLTVQNKLHKALANNEFLAYYQPKMSLSDGRLVGLEALLRWKPAGEDMVLPTHIIPVAEESGLIIPVGEWVLRAACMQNRAWQNAGYAPVMMSVNLSNRQFDQENLSEVVTRCLREAGLEPHYLELEITESAIMQNPDEAITTMHKLKDMGVKISIDDFGTGYSSLNYLRRIPLDFLKIDRTFVSDILDPSNQAIIRAIIALAHSLRLTVVAEGVETMEQLTSLREWGCDEVQGFLISRPIPADKAARLIDEGLGIIG